MILPSLNTEVLTTTAGFTVLLHTAQNVTVRVEGLETLLHK